MAYCVGLDFGTTYSFLSRIREQYDNSGNLISVDPEACLPSVNAQSPSIDSIVLKNPDGTLLFGPLARQKTGRKGTTSYKGFKMMLAETDQEVLRTRGYDDACTPRMIVSAYLENILKNHLAMNPDVTCIDKLVVGVPEIWFSDIATIDCRVTLEDTLSAFPFVGSVELVSEPAAACAYFADNYKKINKGKLFQGRILLVDYGGGTLDIALCDVRQNSYTSEVSVLRRAGAGLNEEGFIGKAGMAFMEAVVKLALQTSGMTDEEIVRHKHFYRSVHAVECALMNRMPDIQAMFDFSKLLDRTELDDVFYDFDFDDEDITVTYGMLAKAYQQVIYPVLEEKLDEIIGYMDTKGINWRVNSDDNFKIALVGGFCNFYLTQEQIEEKFKKAAGDDPRFSGIFSNKSQCEMAISYGAALIANETVGFKPLAPYHLGIARGTKEAPKEFYYAIHKGDEIVYNEPVFITDEEGQERLFAASSIPLLAFSLDDKMEFAQWGEATERYQSKLTLTKNKVYKIGFSLDRSMRITLHKHVVDDPSRLDVVSDKSSVRLNDDIYSILGNITEVRRVK